MLIDEALEMSCDLMESFKLDDLQINIIKLPAREMLGLTTFVGLIPLKIELQKSFVLLNPPAFVIDVLLHEIAHVNSGLRENFHDYAWEMEYLKIGGRGVGRIDPEIIWPPYAWVASCNRCQNRIIAMEAVSQPCPNCDQVISSSDWMESME